MVKKVLVILSVFTLILGLTGCMAAPATQPVANLEVPAESATLPQASGYEKNLDGLVSYMKDSSLIAGDGMDMSFEFIGAAAGKKFSFKYAELVITCELYEFGTNLDDTAKNVISSVKEKGVFTALDKEVKAVLSPSEQFMMIYTCPTDKEEGKAISDKAHDQFSKF